MYSIVAVFVAATAADVPDAHRRSSSGCYGNRPEARSSGCVGQPPLKLTVEYVPVVKYKPVKSYGCHGTGYGAPQASACFGGEGRGFGPLRNIAAAIADNHRDRVDSRQDRAARHGGEVTYFVPASAVAVTAPAVQYPVPQSKCPPVMKP